MSFELANGRVSEGRVSGGSLYIFGPNKIEFTRIYFDLRTLGQKCHYTSKSRRGMTIFFPNFIPNIKGNKFFSNTVYPENDFKRVKSRDECQNMMQVSYKSLDRVSNV